MAMTSPPLARTPLYHWQAAHGARFVTSDGWQIPEVYSTVEQETAAANGGVALADISAFAKVSLLGQGVSVLTAPLLGDGQTLPPRSVARFEAGGEALACRLRVDHLFLLATSTSTDALDKRLASLLQQYPIIAKNVTSAFAGFGLAGPHTGEVLRCLTSLDVSPSALPSGSCAETSLAGIQALLVSPPRSKLGVMHVYVAWDLGEYLWGRLLEAGERHQVAPMGLKAWRAVTGDSLISPLF
jgi:heterotetrameric sarcosine oxidase gamma subunit